MVRCWVRLSEAADLRCSDLAASERLRAEHRPLLRRSEELRPLPRPHGSLLRPLGLALCPPRLARRQRRLARRQRCLARRHGRLPLLSLGRHGRLALLRLIPLPALRLLPLLGQAGGRVLEQHFEPRRLRLGRGELGLRRLRSRLVPRHRRLSRHQLSLRRRRHRLVPCCRRLEGSDVVRGAERRHVHVAMVRQAALVRSRRQALGRRQDRVRHGRCHQEEQPDADERGGQADLTPGLGRWGGGWAARGTARPRRPRHLATAQLHRAERAGVALPGDKRRMRSKLEIVGERGGLSAESSRRPGLLTR